MPESFLRDEVKSGRPKRTKVVRYSEAEGRAVLFWPLHGHFAHKKESLNGYDTL